MKIIILNGSAGVGKDLFFQLFKEINENSLHVSSIAPVLAAAKTLGWSGNKDEASRRLLSEIKKASIAYNDMPYKKTVEAIEEADKNGFDYLFLDIREPSEIEKIIRKYPKTITLLIKRPSVEVITSNSSDGGVNLFDYDYVINNDSTSNFKEVVKTFWESVK